MRTNFINVRDGRKRLKWVGWSVASICLFTFGLGGALAPAAAAATKGAKGKPIEVKISTVLGPGGTEEASLKKFKELLEQRSGGEFVVHIFLSGVLGNEKGTMEQLTLGETEMQFQGETGFATYCPELFPFSIPFLYDSVDLLMKALDGGLGKRIKDAHLQKAKIRFAGYAPRGPRKLSANIPITKVDDVKNLKLRLPVIRPYIEVWKEFGAIPTPVTPEELFSALQLNLVAAQENPLSAILALRVCEVQKYIMNTDHVYGLRVWYISEKFFQKLNARQQETLLGATADAVKYQRKIDQEWEGDLKKQLEQKWGITFRDVDKASFRGKIRPAVERLKSMFDSQAYEQYVLPNLPRAK
jgi:TRAP-type C4-dicarboxylate transport system substrate-binding protein